MRNTNESDPYVRRPTFADPTPSIAMGNIQREMPRARTHGSIGDKGVAHTFHKAFRQLRELKTAGLISKNEFNDRKERLRQFRDVAIETVVNFRGTGGIK